MTHSTDSILENLTYRYATKEFQREKRITPDLLNCIEQSLILTPSSFGLQPWKFFIISDQTVKDKLVEHSWNQQQVSQCSELVVLTAQAPISERHIDEFLESQIAIRGGSMEELSGYKSLMVGFINNMSEEQKRQWAKQQVYIALGQLLTVCASLKIDACPMEGIQPAQYDEVLGLNGTEYSTTLACPIGYRSENDAYAQRSKVRYRVEKLIQYI